jgi:hypothetical protein
MSEHQDRACWGQKRHHRRMLLSEPKVYSLFNQLRIGFEVFLVALIEAIL